MGQNNSTELSSPYNSKDYFKQQVQFYRWRADPLVNTHICKVFFQLQQTVRDKEKLKNFLQDRVSSAEYISIGELMSLANENKNRLREQLMNFENYVCTLAELYERLSLQEVLYVLQIMFNGYETLLKKVGKCKAKLNCCFVTLEGQVRIWFNPDFKSNDVQEIAQDSETKSSVITSEMTLIRRILQLGENLSSNHTEFLHFSRQFRSYMERDILQNWNFANSRKLINSYVYTYRINLPNNLKDLVNKVLKFSALPSEKLSNLDSQLSFASDKKDPMSTGSGFIKQQTNSNISVFINKNDGQRPFCHSDYSNSKKSDSGAEPSIKSHAKKFSSTDLKCQNERNNKGFQSPKMSRSELIPHKIREDMRFKAKEVTNMQFSAVQVQTQRVRRERQFAKVGEKEDGRLYNFSTSVGLSPDTNSFVQPENNCAFENEPNQNNNSILKNNQNAKQKKKLEKKVATISKYISYYQNESQHISKRATGDLTEQIINIKPSIVHFSVQDQDDGEDVSKANNIASNNSMKANLKMPGNQPKIAHKLSYEIKNIHHIDKEVNPCKGGKTEFNRSQCNSQRSDYSSQDNTYPKVCLTVKTLNKLLENNEVSLHESNGSFMSLEGQGSEYSGVLCKMGRSVNIMNVPSNKQVSNLQKKSNVNTLNRSINC